MSNKTKFLIKEKDGRFFYYYRRKLEDVEIFWSNGSWRSFFVYQFFSKFSYLYSISYGLFLSSSSILPNYPSLTFNKKKKILNRPESCTFCQPFSKFRKITVCELISVAYSRWKKYQLEEIERKIWTTTMYSKIEY